MDVPRLCRAVILVLLLAVDVAGGIDLGVAAEAGTVAVVGDDPAALGDLDLAEFRARRGRPRLRGGPGRLAGVLVAVAVRVGEGGDGVDARQGWARVGEAA